MNTSICERECDCSDLASMNHIEASNAIKDFVAEQDSIKPFGIGWLVPRRLELALQYAGFTHLTIAQLPPHPVYIIKGRGSHLGFITSQQLRRYFRQIAREIGFPFREADTTLTCLRGKFRLVVALPTQDNALETLADTCPIDLDMEAD